MSKYSKSYFLGLSKKLFLSPSGSLLEDCSSFLSQLESDLSALKELNTDSVPIYYHHPSLSLSAESLPAFSHEKQENSDILETLTKSYVFTNIREK